MTQEFVTLPREVVEQAIEALFCTDSEEGSTAYENELKAVKKLRAALDQPQANQPAMTPIAQRKLDSMLTNGYTISGYSVYHERKHQHGFVTGAGLVGWWKPEGMEYPQPKREPLSKDRIREILMCNGFTIKDGEPDLKPYVYNAVRAILDAALQQPVVDQPQPERQPLTYEQINRMWHDYAKGVATSKTLPFEWYRLGIRHAEHANNIK